MRPTAPALVAAAALGVLLAAPPSSATTFVAPAVVTSADVRGPDIEIAPNGTILVGATSGSVGGSRVHRSATGGAAWSAPVSPAGPLPGGLALDLTVAPDGAFAFTDLWGGSSTVGKSANRGATWTAQPVQGEVAQDSPWVAAAGGNVVYHATHALGAGIVVSRSSDGGLTYTTRTVVAPDATRGCICPSGNVVASGDRFAVVYSTGTGVDVARSLNGGLTVTTSTVDPVGGLSTLDSFPVLAYGGGSRLAVTWLETGASSSRVRLSVSTDWGASWTAPVSLVTAGASLHPWIAMSGSRVGISLYHTAATGEPGTVPANAAWYESYLDSNDGGSTWSGLATADVTAVKTGPICTGGLSCSGDTELGLRQSMAFDPSGRPNLVYVRSVDGVSNTELRFTRGV